MSEGKECQNTKLSNYTYDELKQKTEKSHVKDLLSKYPLQMLHDIAKDKILKSFEDNEWSYKNAAEAIKKELDIDSKLKAILREKQQPETEETQAYYNVTKVIKETLSAKQLELASKKNHFLANTENVFKHMRIEDSTQYNVDL
ncbi:MAG: hypothetical protein PV340_03705 [Wolbachia sp.]|nr:hypothetical protein [Wolbachia sp.]MDD9336252.1 hypothetical protein [Wolbachia sp.]